MKCNWIRLLLTIVTASVASPVFGQLAEQGAVSGTGTISLTRAPEVMRMHVALTSKGATLKDALAALKTRTDAARLQLTTLGADKGSIKIEAAHIAVQDPNRRNQMQAMMMMRMQQGKGNKGAAKSKTAPPVEVTSNLTAEWKLSAKDPEAMLLLVHPLQEKIRAADLAGKAQAEKLSAEQEEMLEELQANGQSGFSMGGEEQTPGQPDFLFVSRITEAEHDKALADAYQKASVQATRLAKAAGSELGALRSVTSFDDPRGDVDEFGPQVYGSSAYRIMQQYAQKRATSDSGHEAVGVDSSKVKYSVNLTVAFDLKPVK
jgi:uncharacterized protein YggE